MGLDLIENKVSKTPKQTSEQPDMYEVDDLLSDSAIEELLKEVNDEFDDNIGISRTKQPDHTSYIDDLLSEGISLDDEDLSISENKAHSVMPNVLEMLNELQPSFSEFVYAEDKAFPVRYEDKTNLLTSSEELEIEAAKNPNFFTYQVEIMKEYENLFKKGIGFIPSPSSSEELLNFKINTPTDLHVAIATAQTTVEELEKTILTEENYDFITSELSSIKVIRDNLQDTDKLLTRILSTFNKYKE